MPFNEEWFNYLAELDGDRLPPADRGYRPHLSEVYEKLDLFDHLPDSFRNATIQLTEALAEFDFRHDFRVQDRHIYTFPAGTSFDRQKNIGFYADDRKGGPGRMMRVGIGYRFRREHDSGAIEDYAWLTRRIEDNEKEFDETVEELGGYIQPRSLMDAGSLGQHLTRPENSPSFDNGWRFFGDALRWPSDRDVLTSMEKLTARCREVFDRIEASSFFDPAPDV